MTIKAKLRKSTPLNTAEATTADNSDYDTTEQIEQAIAQLAAGDFHSRWDQAKQFTRRFADWGDRAVPVLINQLNAQQDPDTQWFLVRILSQFDQPEVVSAIAHLLVNTPSDELKVEAGKALTTLGNSAIDTLSNLLTTSGPIQQRKLAARALSHIRRGGTIEPLLTIATDTDPELRAIATEALGSFHSPKVTPVLLNALNDEPAICTEAIRALGRRRDLLETVDLIAPLTQCLQSQQEKVACESAKALGRLGSESAVVALSSGLNSPKTTPVKIAIVRALSWIASPTAVQALVTAFGHDTWQITPAVSQEIVRSLGQTRSPELKQPVAAALINRLQTLSEAITLSSTTNPENSHQTTSPEPLLSEQDHLSLKQALISALAQLGQTEAINCLIPCLGDPEPRIKMHALNALTQIDPRASQTKIQHYLADEQLSTEFRAQIQASLSAW